tara:strand:- start:1708 stop:2541 length:834 start_codon:yes stop_codon:yes gene_type:complete
MFVIILVGSVFIIFGSLLLAINIHFLRNGKVLKGKIVGIEKYQSYERNKGTQVFYRPVVEYHFNGATVKFACSFGSSAISYKIGERVSLFSLNKGPEYVRLNSKTLWIFPSIFVVLGSIASIVYLFNEPSLQTKVGVIALILLAILYGYNYLKKKNLIEMITENMLKASVLDSEQLAKREIYNSQSEITREIKRSYKYSLPITTIFACALGYGAYFFYGQLRPSSMEFIGGLLENPGSAAQIQQYMSDKPLLGFLICCFFGVLMIYSIFYQLKTSAD